MSSAVARPILSLSKKFTSSKAESFGLARWWVVQVGASEEEYAGAAGVLPLSHLFDGGRLAPGQVDAELLGRAFLRRRGVREGERLAPGQVDAELLGRPE